MTIIHILNQKNTRIEVKLSNVFEINWKQGNTHVLYGISTTYVYITVKDPDIQPNTVFDVQTLTNVTLRMDLV